MFRATDNGFKGIFAFLLVWVAAIPGRHLRTRRPRMAAAQKK
jgi:hypothetical protein